MPGYGFSGHPPWHTTFRRSPARAFIVSPGRARAKDLWWQWDPTVLTRGVGAAADAAYQSMAALESVCSGYDITTLGDDEWADYVYDSNGTLDPSSPQVNTSFGYAPPVPTNLSYGEGLTSGQASIYQSSQTPPYTQNITCKNQQWRVCELGTAAYAPSWRSVFFWYGTCVVGADGTCSSKTLTKISEIKQLYDSGNDPAMGYPGTLDLGGWPNDSNAHLYVSTFPVVSNEAVILFVNLTPGDVQSANPAWTIN